MEELEDDFYQTLVYKKRVNDIKDNEETSVSIAALISTVNNVKWTKSNMSEISVKILTIHGGKMFDNWINEEFKCKIQLYRKRFTVKDSTLY